MKLLDMIDLLEKLKSQDGDIEITEISVELNESRTTTIPREMNMKAIRGIFNVLLFPAFAVYIAYQEMLYSYKLRKMRKGNLK